MAARRRRRLAHGSALDLRAVGASIPTAEEIDAASSPSGAWTREQLAMWGVSWPPPRRWHKDLLQRRRVYEIYATREGIASVARSHGRRCSCDACLAAAGDDEAWARVRELV